MASSHVLHYPVQPAPLLPLLLALPVASFGSDLPVFDFSSPAEAARWQPNARARLADVSPEGSVVQITGEDPWLTGPAADYPPDQSLWYRLTLKSTTGGTCQVFYYQNHPTEEDSVRFQVPANTWVTGRMPGPPLGRGYHVRIDPPGATGVAILKELKVEPRASLPEFDFRTVPDATLWAPTHDVEALTPTQEGLVIEIGGPDPYSMGPAQDYPPGTPLWMHVRLKSDTGGSLQVFHFADHPTEAASVRMAIPAGQWHEAVAPLPALGPNWKLRLDPPGTSGRCVVERLWFEARLSFSSPAWPKPEVPELGQDAIVLRGGELELLHSRHKLGAFKLNVAGTMMSVGNPNALVGYLAEGKPRWLQLEQPGPGSVVTRVKGDGFEVEANISDPDGATWRAVQTFRQTDESAIAVETRVRVDQNRDLIYLPMFTLLPGVGSFGTNKTQGLFPGLEYLANEPSSSEADIIGDEAHRLAPDTMKVTLPLMVIAAEGRYVGLEWEPRGDMCAVFDSPDRQFKSDGHLLGLLVPGSDGFNREQGSLLPYRPLKLVAGEELVARATIVGGRADSVVPAVQAYVRRHGLPHWNPPVPTAKDYFEQAALSWLDSGIRDGDLYRHAYWPRFNPSPAADAAVWMRWLAGHVTRSQLKARLQGAAADALAQVTPPRHYNSRQIGHVRYPLPALVYRAAQANAVQAAAQGENLLGRFEADGSIRYRPKPEGPDYGSTHFAPDANGLTATVLEGLLEEATFSGDPHLIDEALRLLHALDKFKNTVPRGAQTWEIPLHTPDILASARLARCYTLGYKLTGNSDWLKQAIYWAWTGVPFVYLVPPTPDEIGLYSTIPVLGGTAWVGSWFGRPVQWCGLVYADALNQLAPYDPDGPWRELADAIAASGVQQTWPPDDAERHGLLPDFVRLRTQFRDGPAINPATVLAPAVRFYGEPGPYQFHVFRRHGLRLHAPGAISDLAESTTNLVFTLSNWSQETTELLINGFREQPGVRINGVPVDLGAPHTYEPATGRLSLATKGVVRVELTLPSPPRLRIREASDRRAVELIWPWDNSGFTLEASDTLLDAAWQPVRDNIRIEGARLIATEAVVGRARFFRLRR